MSESDLLRDFEAAEVVGLAVQTLRGWRMQGIGPTVVRKGHRCWYPKAELLEWRQKYWAKRLPKLTVKAVDDAS